MLLRSTNTFNIYGSSYHGIILSYLTCIVSKYLLRNYLIIRYTCNKGLHLARTLSNSLLLIMLVFLLKLQRPTYLDIFIHSKGTLIGYPITTHVRTLTSFDNARLNKIAYKNHDRKFLQSI